MAKRAREGKPGWRTCSDHGSDGRGHRWTDSSSVEYCTGSVDQADGRGPRLQEEPWADGCVDRALFLLDHTNSMHCDERARGTGRLVALNSRRLQSQASSSSSSMNATLTSGRRRWKAIPAVRPVENSCYWISKREQQEFHVTLMIFENLIGQSNGERCSRSIIAKNPCRCQRLATARMD